MPRPRSDGTPARQPNKRKLTDLFVRTLKPGALSKFGTRNNPASPSRSSRPGIAPGKSSTATAAGRAGTRSAVSTRSG